ncbi:MAG: hypothetical protein ACE5HI_02630 [bacterium]
MRNNIGNRCFKDEILIQAFASASALKNEIRDRITRRKKVHWNLCSIKSQGAFITLFYTQSN